jgi:ParB/RepB/Spo0J family partition protein
MPIANSSSLAPPPIGVKKIPTEGLLPNPYNPRMLFDQTPMQVLKDSIAKVGILVPLTVYWSDENRSYVILDGQRRWICAQKLGIKEVPVNQVAEPTLVQNIVTMFQIHKLREDWELMPTALKLEILMVELHERNDARLATLCGLDKAVVVRCKKLLSYSKKYQDMMLEEEPIARVKADFFIELYSVVNDRFVKSLPWYRKDNFIQRMLDKYKRRKGIKSVTDFRLIKQHIANARTVGKASAISKRLKEFAEDDTLTLDHLVLQSATVAASARKLLTSVRKLFENIEQMDAAQFYGEEELWRALEALIQIVRRKLVEAARRLKE